MNFLVGVPLRDYGEEHRDTTQERCYDILYRYREDIKGTPLSGWDGLTLQGIWYGDYSYIDSMVVCYADEDGIIDDKESYFDTSDRPIAIVKLHA